MRDDLGRFVPGNSANRRRALEPIDLDERDVVDITPPLPAG